MNDLISRQAAIDALDDAITYYSDLANECQRKAHIESNDYMDSKDRAAECQQLAEWLNELKYLRERIDWLLACREDGKK